MESMKVLAGLVATGVLAASGAVAAVAPAAPTGGNVPRREHFAFLNTYEYLDGPRLEAMSGRSENIAWDEKGNMYLFATRWYSQIRCIRTDGRIVPISGNDYWELPLALTEGPASALRYPSGGMGTVYSYPSGGIAVMGVPDEGEDKGCIYVSAAGDGVDRVFRNKAQGGRWWFERAMGAGKEAAPKKRGESVNAKDVDLGNVTRLEIGSDGKLLVYAKGAFLQYEDGKLNCLLGPDDYVGKGGAGPKGPCREGYLAGDGSFYLGTYYDGEGYGGKGVAIYRVTVSSDGVKVVPCADCKGRSTQDGDATDGAGWFCGPHFPFGWNEARYQPPDILIPAANDEAALRRILNGRSATLCADGEWREFGRGKNKDTPKWFHTWRIGPDGTGYQTYSGGDWLLDTRMYRITGIDYTRPTAK